MYFFVSMIRSESIPKVWNIPEIPPKDSKGIIIKRTVLISVKVLQIIFMPVVISRNGASKVILS